MFEFVLDSYAQFVKALPFGSGYILPEILLTVGLLLVLILTILTHKKTPEENQALMQVSLIFVLGALALLTMNFWVLEPMVSEEVMFGTLTSDLFAYLMRIMLLLGAAVTIALSNRFLEQHTRVIGDFYILIMGATLGGLFLASASDLIAVFVGLETLSITSYILAGFLRKTARSSEASFKYLIFGGIGTAIFLFGLSLVYGLAGSTNFAEIAVALHQYQGVEHPTLIVLTLLTFSAMAFKLSSAPFHMWTPDVYEGAPTPVSAFLSVVSKAAALAVTVRMLLVMFAGFEHWPVFWGILAVLSMIIGNFVALQQKDVKRLLAYSTIAHAGYMLLGLVVATPLSIGGMLYYMLAYVFMNLGAFASVIYFGLLTRTNDISAYSGLIQKRPGLVIGFTVCLLSLTGIPFTSGFFAKFFLFQTVALADPVYLWLVIIALITSTISLAYYLNIVRLMVVKEPSPAVQAIPARAPAPWPLSTALAFCTAVTLILGIFAQPFFMFSTMSAEQLAHERPLFVGQAPNVKK
jgi:NAD(P)H-quinone oxidoreductase subunit 2